MMLTQLGSSMPVDVMPGDTDPSNFLLPQQPMRECLVPSASQYSSIQHSTNPHDVSLDGVRVLGTSGQPIADMHRYTDGRSVLDTMSDTLHASHIAPTAPDTLCCLPFFEQDPFVLTECPHIYFAGCQGAFGSRLVTGQDGQKVQMVAVPSFATTESIVLVNLRTLAAHEVCFSAS